jgi:WD40 repeat protein
MAIHSTSLARRTFLQAVAAMGCSCVVADEKKDAKAADADLPKGLRRLDVGYVVRGLAVSPDSKLLATCGTDQMHVTKEIMLERAKRKRLPKRPVMIVLWDLAMLKPVHVLDGSKDCMSVAFSPDGKLVAGGRLQRGARVWSVTTGLETATLYDPIRLDDGQAHSIQFTSDSKKLVYGFDARCRIWDIARTDNGRFSSWFLCDMGYRLRTA